MNFIIEAHDEIIFLTRFFMNVNHDQLSLDVCFDIIKKGINNYFEFLDIIRMLDNQLLPHTLDPQTHNQVMGIFTRLLLNIYDSIISYEIPIPLTMIYQFENDIILESGL